MPAPVPPSTRLGPVVLESEMIVLGRCVQSFEAIEKAKSALTPNDFWRTPHATIFKAVCAVDPTNDASPLTQVTDTLRKTNQLEAVGTHAWFTEVIERAVTDANLPFHIRRILSASAARQAMTLALEVYESASEGKDWWAPAERLLALRPQDTPKPKRRFLGYRGKTASVSA